MIKYNHSNIENARMLRRNMTPCERKLWYMFLKQYPVRFQRQKLIMEYIADFYCAKAKLVVELDGGGHFAPENQQNDAERTAEIESCGIKVIRFTNTEIEKEFYNVCTVIDQEIKARI